MKNTDATGSSLANRLMEFSRAEGVLAIRGLQATLIDAAIALDNAVTRTPSTEGGSEGETPRTDAILKLGINDIPQASYQELIDFARQLERELADLHRKFMAALGASEAKNDEIAQLRHDLERAMANRNADLNSAPSSKAVAPTTIPLGEGYELVKSSMGPWKLRLGDEFVRCLTEFEASFVEGAIAACVTPSATRVAEVRLNSDGTLDEVVTKDGDQLEQMDYNHWFLQIGDVAVWLHAKGKITANYERRSTSTRSEIK